MYNESHQHTSPEMVPLKKFREMINKLITEDLYKKDLVDLIEVVVQRTNYFSYLWKNEVYFYTNKVRKRF